MGDGQIQGDHYERMLAKAIGWTCLSLVVVVVVGSATASVMAVVHDKPLVHLVWVGVAGVCWILIHAALRCAGVPVSRRAKKAAWGTSRQLVSNASSIRPAQKRSDRRAKDN